MVDVFWRDKNVLVGGGGGFLGSYLVPELLDKGARVTVADDLSNGSTEFLPLDDIRFEQGDLSDRSFAESATESQDVMINLAARAFGMEYSRSHHGEMLVSNLLCTLVPLEAARVNRVDRVVVMSSSCVYPDDAPVPTPELDVFSGLPESVNEGYGWSKRIEELAGRYYASEYEMKIFIVRPFNPYGGHYRWGSEDKAHVVPSLVKRIMDGEDPVVVWGSGNQERNFLHASDAVRLIMKIVEQGPVAQPVNIGYDETTTIRDLVDLICNAAGVQPEITFDTSKPEGRFKKSADASFLREVTADYVPKVSLETGISEMVDWYHRTFGGTRS